MRRQRYSQLANKLKPYMNQSAVVILNTGATGEAPGDHVHDFTGLEGELLPEQAPWVTSALNALKPHGIADPVYHSATGPAKSVIGLTADDTIGLLSSTADGLTNLDTLLRSGPAGELTIGQLAAGPDMDVLNTLGRARVGAMLALDTASFSHYDHITTPAVTQNNFGTVTLMAPPDQRIAINVNGEVVSFAVGEMRVRPSARLQTENYASQLSGWRHTYDGELDTRYIFANQMKIVQFIADMEVALAGSQLVTKSVTELAEPFTAPAPSLSSTLIVDDLPTGENVPVFEDGDVVCVRKTSRSGGGFSNLDCWGTVSGYLDDHDTTRKRQSWGFTRLGNYSAPVPEQTSYETANSSSNSLNVTRPDGPGLRVVKAGTLLIAFVLAESTTITTTAPAGWILRQTATVTGMRASLYTKIAGASEPASYTWFHSGSVDSMVIIHGFNGVDATAPFTGFTMNAQESSTAAPVIKSLNVLTNSDFYLGYVAARANRNPVIQPEGWISHYSGSAGGNTIAAMSTLTDGYAGDPFGDVSAALSGGTARTITATINITPFTGVLTLESGYMPAGEVTGIGAIVRDYGKSGDGWHEISAIDGIYGSNAPYSRVITWTGHPATGAVVRTQDGNLNGIFGEGKEWGFFAGDGYDPLYSHFLRISTRGARLNNLGMALYSAGTQRVNISADGQDIWVGTALDKRISWNGLTLGIKGAITIDQASGFANTGYLQIGTGVKDSNLSGFHLGPVEIVGQLAGVDQVVMDLNGRLTAGAGNVWMDASGINTLQQTTEDRISHLYQRGYTIRRSDNGALIGRLTGNYLSGNDQYGIDLYALAPNSQKSKAVIGAQAADLIYSPSSPGSPRLEAYSDPAMLDYLRLFCGGKIQLFQSGSATPDFQLQSGQAEFSVNVYAPWLNLGSIAQNYTPTALNWGGAAGTTLLLNGQDYTTIGFHDSGNRVDFIRVGNGLITLGYDGGFGVANVKVGGYLSTNNGAAWDLGTYAAGAPTVTGYITVRVNGANYRIATQAV